MAHSRETAHQVRSEYIDTMGKMYYSYFKDYHSKLMKLQVRGVEAKPHSPSHGIISSVCNGSSDLLLSLVSRPCSLRMLPRKMI